MKILLSGKDGQVGSELCRSLMLMGEVVALGRSELDLANPKAVRSVIRDVKPDVIVNAAAYTAVDKAEDDEELATIVNAEAPGLLAEESRRLNALFVHYSTDYVFDGLKRKPYVEQDAAEPINAYGRSKLAGENAIQSVGCDSIILRTSWVYGLHGHNFLKTIIRLAAEKEELRIVDDQLGSPTWAFLIANATSQVIRHEKVNPLAAEFKSKTYHLTSRGVTSWFGFAQAILERLHDVKSMDVRCKKIVPIPTSSYPTPAARPERSQLDVSSIENDYGLLMPDWQQSLEACMCGIDTCVELLR